MSQTIEQSVTELSETLRLLRKDRGWSQEALAKRMRDLGQDSWRQTTVAKVEAKSRPRPVTLQEAIALAAAFGVPRITDLFGESSHVAERLTANFSARNDERIAGVISSFLEGVRKVAPERAQRAEEVLHHRVGILTQARNRAAEDLKKNGLKARDLMDHVRDIDPDVHAELVAQDAKEAGEV